LYNLPIFKFKIFLERRYVELITENLSTLKIHKLTQEQYDRELAAGNIDENALYLTPDEAFDLSKYVTIEQLNQKADIEHNHDDVYYTEIEIDTLLENKKNRDFVVTITGNDIDGYTSDKTATEIYEAYNSGKCVYAKNQYNGILNLTQCGSTFANFESFSTSTKTSNLFVVTNSKTVRSTSSFYTKAEIDAEIAEIKSYIDTSIANLQLITTDDIDGICNGT
jgi:hypothetical protein